MALTYRNQKGRLYIAKPGNCIVGFVTKSAQKQYRLAINGILGGWLNKHAFNGATERQHPRFDTGSIVFGWVNAAAIGIQPSITCQDPNSRKDWQSREPLFGIVASVSNPQTDATQRACMRYRTTLKLTPHFAQTHGIELGNELGDLLQIEIAVGENGLVLIASSQARDYSLARAIFQCAFNKGIPRAKALIQYLKSFGSDISTAPPSFVLAYLKLCDK